MRKALLVTCLVSFWQLVGCSLPNALFNVLGDNYTGGGETREAKQNHFNQQFETSSHPSPWNE